ncbi:uncharacterized protein ARMOST_15908 [Armillaria ostoyae]|uniref:Uncharacterized protein n=1 Tax=Armillaria ostoyae TaxID=47428 RepID=A0A284RUP4_ARMOS|nr:uncharacterized protein ARMOST_15908 [Armillaria ostoyae]
MTWLEILSASSSEMSTPGMSFVMLTPRENESLDDVGDGMKGNRIEINANVNGIEKTGNVLALQSVQKTVCSEFSVVVRRPVTPSGDFPLPVLPNSGARSVLVIAYKLEPVRCRTLLNITYSVSQMTFEGRRPRHWPAFTTPISQPTIRQL